MKPILVMRNVTVEVADDDGKSFIRSMHMALPEHWLLEEAAIYAVEALMQWELKIERGGIDKNGK